MQASSEACLFRSVAKNTSLWPQFPPWHKLVWLLLVFASAQATASDLTGTEGASSAPIGTPYVPPQYTFTARFPQPSTDLQTARLEGLDSAGRVVADLGPLYDDGTHGDEVAGDGIYQLVREVSMAASIARYRASIGLSNATRRVSASTLSVKINIAPSADAGRDRAAAVGLPLSLDGRNSRDPELQPLDFRWELSERPPESQATLDEPARVAPNFTPDVAGDYRFTLIVNDGRMDSLPALLHIHAAEPDAAPNADAGRIQAVRAGASVRLDGSASRDPENLPLSYLWTLTDKPVGSTAQLLDAHGPQPSFTADLRGLYRARLDVRDAIQAGTPATVVVAAYGGNTPPTAVAGSDQTVRTGTLVQLDGSASFDPDPDDAVSAWTWRLVAQPAGSKVSLGNAKRPNARFTATQPGDYLLELQVTDRVGASASARVLIRATSNLPVPVLSSIEPTGSSAGAAALTLDARGANFMNSSKLLFGSSLLGTHYLAADRLQAELPAAMLANPGVFDVRVRTPGGGDSAALPFTIGPPALLLSTLIPPSVEANHDASLVLTGANFGSTARALLGSLPLATTRESANRLVAALPAAAIQNPGAYSVQVFESSGRASNVLILTVTEPPGPQIDAISPAEGEAGTTVTITGTRFGDSAAANRVAFAGTPAQITSAQADRITVLVPQTANSGPLSVSVAGRSASGPSFTVLRAQDASLSASPAQASVYPGAATAIALRLTDQGTRAYTGAMQLAVTGLPAGISARFDTPALSANQTATLTLSAAESAAAGSFPLRVSATGPTSAGSAARTAAASITVLPRPAAGLTGVTGRFIDASGAPIAGIIVRADLGLTAQNPETRTDAAGNFVLTGLPAGTVTLRFDATPAHPLYPIWPQQVVVTAGRMLAMEDWVLKPPPAAERFSAIQPNSPADQVVTDARFPGLEIRIPAGVSITGWDGVPKTRIAVERLDPGSLPVASPPIKTKSVYQLFFGSAMGGVPSQPIPITLPNDLGLEPGTQTPLWYYDGSPMGGTGEWKQGGTGTVSADGSVIVSDAGSGIPRFCGVCGLPCFQGTQDAAPNPPCPDCEARAQRAGKPITLATGQELETAVDLVVPGEVPIVISRSYNPFDAFAYIANFQQSLGVNWTLNYDVAIMPFTGDHSVRMVQPGNSRIDMGRGGDGRFRSSGNLQYDGAELIKVGGTNPSIIGQLDGGTRPPTVSVEPVTCIGYDGSYYELRQRDGRVLRFDAAPSATRVRIRGGCLYFLTEIRDPQSRYLRIVRGGDGKISRIETSSGQSASFSYGAGGVVSSITDQSGRSVQYQHERVDALGGFRGFGAETVGGGSQTRAVEVAAVGAGISPLAPYRMVSASTPAGTYAYTYEDDPPNLRLGGLSFVDTLASSSSAVSAAAPTCANVRGGARIKTIQLPGVDGVFTNYYGPSKRVLRQTWPDGTDLRFNYKIVGGCVPGLRSADAGSGNGNELTRGSTNGTCRGAGCPRIDSWEGQSVTGGDIVGTEVLDSRGNKISQDFNGSGLATQATDANGQPVTYTRDA
ncbi:MAG: IPT/TIG domain-containing protein, partial [Rhodocyclaceae bacterium]|nr:IPT/TIG domain-containing protein [Rhodocyclaceae bacterium]